MLCGKLAFACAAFAFAAFAARQNNSNSYVPHL